MDIIRIKAAAHKWAIDNNRKFPHLTIPEFVAGALWALKQVDAIEAEEAVKCNDCGSTDLFLAHQKGRCNDCGATV